jgi:hypothetical protein
LPGFFKFECGGGSACSAGMAAAVLVVWLHCLPKIYRGDPVGNNQALSYILTVQWPDLQNFVQKLLCFFF